MAGQQGLHIFLHAQVRGGAWGVGFWSPVSAGPVRGAHRRLLTKPRCVAQRRGEHLGGRQVVGGELLLAPAPVGGCAAPARADRARNAGRAPLVVSRRGWELLLRAARRGW